jgi:hypothetical protein
MHQLRTYRDAFKQVVAKSVEGMATGADGIRDRKQCVGDRRAGRTRSKVS